MDFMQPTPKKAISEEEKKKKIVRFYYFILVYIQEIKKNVTVLLVYIKCLSYN